MPQDYNTTLNLPKTDFPMRGNLPKKEPDTLSFWEANRIYYKMIDKNQGRPLYVLHDGPPYANGEIHLGTALNKTLKDIIIKYKNMAGFCAPYVPGWDTHGLPIELKAMKAIGVKDGAIPPVELRKHCKDFAMMHVNNQMKQFKRLGCWGDYDYPYLTLRPEYEAKQVEVFGKMAKDGHMYKGLKPVYWCPDCNTALAEAEIEYANDPCHSIYVKFKVVDDKGKFTPLGIDLNKTFFVIWTTTTWTIPGNLAICLGPDYEYTIVNTGNEYLVMAAELVDATMKAGKIENYSTIGSFKGSELEYIQTKHPLFNRNSPIIVGSHVTLESGTGCVHTAPGHGVEDFEVCKKYPEIDIIVPVDSKGVLTDEAGEFSGLTTDDANKAIAKKLDEENALFAIEKIIHQYPHCWRCSSPIIFRATEQWFCSVKNFKDDAVKAIENVQWIPAWGEERIKGMVRDRSDWCISRQRTWGVPIPVIYCSSCKKPIITDDTIKAISNLFRTDGADAWYTKDIKDFIPDTVKCECGCSDFYKEMDIMDVWFDSGVSHAAVLEEFDKLRWPADLYLEGADQYRGWFQSSLLTSVVWKGSAPYKAVCTHGWVVDGEGKKMSKSLGNGIMPDEIIQQYGADILRLWVASSDYHSDIRISKDILKQLSDAYKKIRNTARFILGNLTNGSGFNPDTDSVSDEQLLEIDKLALMKFDTLIDKTTKGYDAFDFHVVFHAIYNFCVTDMSNFYLDILKDRLYCEKENSVKRRAAQTTMYRILSGVARLIAPIMSYTSEEIWSYMPHTSSDDTTSIVMNQIPEKSGINFDDDFIRKWDVIYTLRQEVNKALEIKRNDKVIGKPLEASVTIYCDEKSGKDLYNRFKNITKELAEIFIVSEVSLEETDGSQKIGEFNDSTLAGISYTISKAQGEKCERCWIYSKDVGKNHDHPSLCARCASVID